MCFKTGCVSYRKSIRRDVLEDEFEDLLEGIQPTKAVVIFTHNMLRDIWNQLQRQAHAQKQLLGHKIAEIETQVEKLLDKIVSADNSVVMSAYEKRIDTLTKDRLVMSEKLTSTGKPQKGFEELFKLAMEFMANPRILWDSGRLEHRQTVG